MLTRFIEIQLVLFTVLTVMALTALGWYYLRLPDPGRHRAVHTVRRPARVGRPVPRRPTSPIAALTIGKVTDVEPTEHGARATMSIDDKYKIPVDSTANVHSVSAIGEQYLDLVSTRQSDAVPRAGADHHQGHRAQRDRAGARRRQPRLGRAAQGEDRRPCWTRRRRPSADWVRRCNGWSTAPRRSSATSRPTSTTSTTSSTTRRRSSTARSTRATRSSGGRPTSTPWRRRAAAQDQAVARAACSKAAPTADPVTAVFSDVREALPQTLANLEVVLDMLKRYNKGLEQAMVVCPQGAAVARP